MARTDASPSEATTKESSQKKRAAACASSGFRLVVRAHIGGEAWKVIDRGNGFLLSHSLALYALASRTLPDEVSWDVFFFHSTGGYKFEL